MVQNVKLVKCKTLHTIQTALSKVKNNLPRRISSENLYTDGQTIQELYPTLKVASSVYVYKACMLQNFKAGGKKSSVNSG